MAGDKNQIPTTLDRIHSQPHSFSQSALDSVAVNSISDPATYRKATTAIGQVVGQET
jgi:hypothetical protein